MVDGEKRDGIEKKNVAGQGDKLDPEQEKEILKRRKKATQSKTSKSLFTNRFLGAKCVRCCFY